MRQQRGNLRSQGDFSSLAWSYPPVADSLHRCLLPSWDGDSLSEHLPFDNGVGGLDAS